MKPHLVEQWVIPPSEDAAFVAAIETVLELYQKLLDTDVPVVNMDEQPVMLRDDVRDPQPTKPGQVMRVDYEYNATARHRFSSSQRHFLVGVVCLFGSVGQRWIGQRK